jgi:hypothetical protein
MLREEAVKALLQIAAEDVLALEKAEGRFHAIPTLCVPFNTSLSGVISGPF